MAYKGDCFAGFNTERYIAQHRNALFVLEMYIFKTDISFYYFCLYSTVFLQELFTVQYLHHTLTGNKTHL
ncbi:hypothetical protein D9M68_774380 [compost metagenome]